MEINKRRKEGKKEETTANDVSKEWKELKAERKFTKKETFRCREKSIKGNNRKKEEKEDENLEMTWAKNGRKKKTRNERKKEESLHGSWGNNRSK